MPITGIWLGPRLKDIFIESKNAQIGVWKRKIWLSEVGVHQEPHYCINPHNSVPEGEHFGNSRKCNFSTQIRSENNPLNRLQIFPMPLTWHNMVPKSAQNNSPKAIKKAKVGRIPTS